jgi:hypothetical protein
MSVLISSSSYRALREGPQVLRAAAALPQTTQTALFTIAGGLVIITKLVGIVTTVVQAQATTTQLIATPTVGSPTNLSTASGDLNAAAVGATLVPGATVGAALTLSGAGVPFLMPMPASLIVATGTIDLKTVASSTGAIRWMLNYVPLDDGASVVAA